MDAVYDPERVLSICRFFGNLTKRKLKTCHQDADDIAHDIYINVVHRLQSYDPSKVNDVYNYVAYLARKQHLEIIRKHCRHLKERVWRPLPDATTLTTKPTVSCGRKLQALIDLIARPDEKLRLKGWLAGEDGADYAKQTGTTVSTASNVMKRFLRRARKFCDHHGLEFSDFMETSYVS